MGVELLFHVEHWFIWFFCFARSWQAFPPPLKCTQAHTHTHTHTLSLNIYFQCSLTLLSMTTWKPPIRDFSSGHCLWLQLLHRKQFCHVSLISSSTASFLAKTTSSSSDRGHYNILFRVSKTEFFRTLWPKIWQPGWVWEKE